MKLETFTSTSTKIKGLVWAPASQKTNERNILYLHGAGGFGTGLAGLYEHKDLPSLIRDGLRLDCRVVIPSCHTGDQWQPNLISSFLNDYEQIFGIPTQGYDIMGYSRGGYGAYKFAASEPSRIRTLSVFSSPTAPELASEISSFPVFICHGLADQKISAESSKNMHKALVETGCNASLSLLQGDHYIIAQALIESGVLSWQKEVI